MERYNRIIRNRLFSIFTTLVFLIGSTYCWFNFKKFDITYVNYEKENIVTSKDIAFSNLEQVSDKECEKIKSYNLTISNTGDYSQDIKITIVPDLIKENVSNNYIKYSINGGMIHSLNMDGIIYFDNLKEYETKDIDLKFWISDTYKGELNYNGRVIVS